MESVLLFWFPNDHYQPFWFDSSKDAEITTKFKHLLSSNINDDNIFAKIILYDQIARNIARFTEDPEQHNTYLESQIINNPYWQFYYDTALQLSFKLLNENLDLQYPIYQRIFILLPLRHSKTTPNLDFVMQRLNLYSSQQLTEEDIKFLNRFRIATLNDYLTVTDTTHIITKISDHMPSYDENIHDINCKDMILLKCKYMEQLESMQNSELLNNIKLFLITNKITKIAVSLSGGVDSNVLLFILYILRSNNIIHSLVAIHIDYNFRNESLAEATYLIKWCQYFNIPIIVRKINHFPSNIYDIVGRDFYEEHTKSLRFNLYHYAIRMFGVQGICLGHHKDDLIENVFMNMLKGKDLLELFNMSAISHIHDVPILRPMLNNHKKDIYDYAHLHHILYFKDTTPDWSFRGTMRRKIFPEIEKFDNTMLNNLIKIGHQSEQLKQTITDLAIDPIINSLEIGYLNIGFRITINVTVKFNSSYWSKILSTIFHKQHHHMISHKNVDAFNKWINSDSSLNSIIRLSNKFIAILNNNQLYFFKMNLFQKIDPIEISIYTSPIKYNEWSFTFKEITSVRSLQFCVKNKFNLDDLLKGSFTYTIGTCNDKVKIGYVVNNPINKLFGSCMKMNEVIPKCYSVSDSEYFNKYIEVTIKYDS